jgi:hypothetical protein
MKPLLKLTIAALFATFTASAQTNVGINNSTPDASAALDVTSTTQGLLAPRMTLAQRGQINLVNNVSTPATGLLIYQTDNTPGFYYYTGSAWTALAGINGRNALVKTTAEAAGANCAAGGTRIDAGQDVNGNGVLDAGEITATRYVCNGAAGSNGQGVPAGGTTGQVLTKVDGTSFNTQWTTPTASGGARTELIATKTSASAQTLPLANGTNSGNAVLFDNVTTQPTLGSFNASTGIYTVGTGGGGLYLIQARMANEDNSTTPSNTISLWGWISVNGSAISSPASLLSGYIGSSPTNLPTGAKGTGHQLMQLVYLNDGDNIRIFGLGANSSVAPMPMKTDGSCKLYVVKLN